MSIEDTLWLPVFDPYTEVWMSKKFRARVFEHRTADGRVIVLKLLPVGVLAEAIGRTRARIHEWEKKGLFPKPCFGIRNTKVKRWYSVEQIRMVQTLMRGILGDNPLRNNNQLVNHAAFFQAVKKRWQLELEQT